jgi:L-histidine N-alpha-methyltransferase
MYIQATRPVSARLAALDLSLVCQPGEVILTETCQKFTPAKVGRDLRTAGLKVDQWFTDSRNWFSLVLLKKKV